MVLPALLLEQLCHVDDAHSCSLASFVMFMMHILSPRSSDFDPVPLHVTFLVDSDTDRFFSRHLRFFAVSTREPGQCSRVGTVRGWNPGIGNRFSVL